MRFLLVLLGITLISSAPVFAGERELLPPVVAPITSPGDTLPAATEVTIVGPYTLALPMTQTTERYVAQDRAFELAMLDLINAERRANGLVPLAEDAALTQAARGFAIDGVTHDFFSHISLSGVSPEQRMSDAGFAGRPWSEVIVGTLPGYTPEPSFQAWMASPPHRALLLDPDMRFIGLGYSCDGVGANPGMVVGDLGRP